MKFYLILQCLVGKLKKKKGRKISFSIFQFVYLTSFQITAILGSKFGETEKKITFHTIFCQFSNKDVRWLKSFDPIFIIL